MIFEDRVDAGRRLAHELKEYAHKPDTLVIALPRGGVVVGYEVASALDLPLDILSPRKIGAPINPELAIGAITETGEGILSEELIAELDIPPEYIQRAIAREKEEARRRLHTYRQGRPPRNLQDKVVLLVDDGLATGATMRAAIRTCRAENAATLIMAIPVAPPDTLDRLKKEVDKTICLAAPASFFAVGQFYKYFDQTSDREVIELLEKQFAIHP